MATVFARSSAAVHLDIFKGDTHAELSGSEMESPPTSQIRIMPGGEWHRRGPEAERTACGLSYLSCAVRPYVGHQPDLCIDCFTMYERGPAPPSPQPIKRPPTEPSK